MYKQGSFAKAYNRSQYRSGAIIHKPSQKAFHGLVIISRKDCIPADFILLCLDNNTHKYYILKNKVFTHEDDNIPGVLLLIDSTFGFLKAVDIYNENY